MSRIYFASVVAVVIDGAIHFGVVSEIITRENQSGEKKSYKIERSDAIGRTAIEEYSADFDGILAVNSIYESDVKNLMALSPAYKWANKRAEELENPMISVPIPTPMTVDTPIAQMNPVTLSPGGGS